MSKVLALSPDELLTTTRSVRKRLDYTRAIPRELVVDCVRIAQQAPQGSNIAQTQFVLIDDKDMIAAVAAIYLDVFETQYVTDSFSVFNRDEGDDTANQQNRRVAGSVEHLARTMHQAPMLALICAQPRFVPDPVRVKSRMGSVMPGIWSFMLAARARGLGTCWTGFTNRREAEMAELLGIPLADVEQVALTPVAYTIGTDFRPARRDPPESIIHWNSW
ncbi:MAG: nitroreductase family protein [Nitriliruptoraceae bacterium]